jgi:hypothetical protein
VQSDEKRNLEHLCGTEETWSDSRGTNAPVNLVQCTDSSSCGKRNLMWIHHGFKLRAQEETAPQG